MAWIVAGAVVLVIAGGAWYGHVQNTYRPTGDALFDQFATRALAEMPRYSALQELGFDWFNPQQYAYADLMPVVKNMEQDWGGDPRYWQLRWLTQQWSFVQSSTDFETQNVIDAIERGVVDENSYGAISYDSLYNTDPALALRYIGKAIDAQDNTYFHYGQACLLARELRMDEALKAVRRGNKAEYNRHPQIFPVGYLDDPEVASTRANQAVLGEIANSVFSRLDLVTFIQRKQLMRDFLALDKEEITPARLDDMLAYSVKFSRTERREVTRLLVSMVLPGLIFEFCEDHPELDLIGEDQIAGWQQTTDELNSAVKAFLMQGYDEDHSAYNANIDMYQSVWREHEFVLSVEHHLDPYLDRPFSAYAASKNQGGGGAPE